MKFDKYVRQLQMLLEDNPELKDLEVVYAADGVNDNFKPVCFSPSFGNYNGEFTFEEDLDEKIEVNAICVN